MTSLLNSPAGIAQASSRSLKRLPLRPTAAGLFWLLAVMAQIATAVNYGNNLVFALAFLMLAVWLQSGWQCHRLLGKLAWQPNSVTPVFAGEALRLDGRLSSQQPCLAEVALTGRRLTGAATAFDSAGEATPIIILPTSRRGEQLIDDLALVSRWPLGLWQTRRPLPAMRALVYPHPAGEQPLPGGNPRMAHRQAATDDFQGLRTYMPGDSPRRINWRVFGRRDELAVNRFDGDAGGEALWLDWALTDGDGETRLAQLAAWLLATEHAGRDYGLRLPGQALPPSRGRPHRDQCLTLLALFNPESFSGPTP